MRGLVILLLTLMAVSAQPGDSSRIMGGTVTTINQYPDMAALMYATSSGYLQYCGGTILNNRSILTAAQCTSGVSAAILRTRLGSSFASSGGVVFNILMIINHPSFNFFTFDNDIAIIRIQGEISFSNVIRQGMYAGPNYNVPDNQVVWATGWGSTSAGGAPSDHLRHVQIYTVNQNICVQRFSTIASNITDNMLCAGRLELGGRGQCSQDTGGPLYHNAVVIGVTSFSPSCGDPQFPVVHARVQRYTDWIIQNQ